MTVKRAKIQIDVEATTEGAVRGLDRVTSATEKSRKAIEKDDKALKSVSQEYKIAAARAENLAVKERDFAAAIDRSTSSATRHAAAMARSNAAAASGGASMASMAATAGKVAGGLGLVTAAGVGAATVVSDLAAESLEVQGVFSNIPYSLNAAREATRGLADDMTLARFSIMANQAGVATTGQAYGELTGMAQKLAFKLGRDVNDSIERVTLGIAKQEREVLDELLPGLARMKDMWASYAKTQGKASKDLTDLEKNTAFTTAVIEEMRKATQGVEVDMSGAAASIARTAVEVKNLKTEMLGGIEAETSLRDGVRQLDVSVVLQVKNMRAYRSSFYEVSDALEAAGVNVEKYRGNQALLAKDIAKVQALEVKRLVHLAEEGKITNDLVGEVQALYEAKAILSEYDQEILYRSMKRLDAENEIERVATRAAAKQVTQRNDRIIEIEEQLAFGRAAQISQDEINKLVAEEAELRAQVLELEGKGAEAAEIRRKSMLDGLAAEGAKLAPRRGGRRRASDDGGARAAEEMARSQAALRQSQFESMQKMLTAAGKTYSQKSAASDPFSEENLHRQLENVIDFEDKRAEIVLSRRLREIETMRAAGADPVQMLEAETSARIEALRVTEDVSQRRYEREIMLAEELGDVHAAAMLRAEQEQSLAESQDQQDAQLHSLAMARLQERNAAEEQAHARRSAIVEQGSELAIGAAAAVVEASAIQGRGLKQAIAATAKAEAMRHGLILGPSELIRAAISFASYNYAAGAAHLVNAGQSFAFAGAMAGVAGAAGGFSGGGRRGPSVPGALGADAFGGGQAQAPRSGEGGGADMGSEVPLSTDTRRQVSSSAASSSGTGSGPVVNQTNNFTVIGSIDDKAAMTIAKGMDQAAQRQGRLASGGRR